jgi:hypothetical protein
VLAINCYDADTGEGEAVTAGEGGAAISGNVGGDVRIG